MNDTFYGIYSKRGLWVEALKGPKGGTKKITLYYKSTAEKKAQEMSEAHKLKYWASPVTIKEHARR